MLPWTPTLIAILCSAQVVVWISGCSRTVLVNEGSPMRIGPKTAVPVYVRVDGEWTLSNNPVQIPEGWYLVPPSYISEPDPLPGHE